MDLVNVPAEVLVEIFAALRETEGLSSLLPCLAVCKTWSSAAQTALWAHVVVTKRNIKPLLRVVETADSPPAQSLTISISITADYSAADELRADLDRLAAAVQRSPSFRFISTFSLTISDGPECKCPKSNMDFFIARRTIADFLRALPPSCVNLELLTNAWELPQNTLATFDRDHLCPVIRSLLRRMHHVRLRLGSICSKIHRTGLFRCAQAPDLRTLCISLHAPGDDKAHKGFDCAFARRLLVKAAKGNRDPPVAYPYRKDLVARGLISSLRRAIATASAFPRLERAEITNFQDNSYGYTYGEEPLPDSWILAAPLYITFLAVRDLLADRVILLPLSSFSAVDGREFGAYDRHEGCHIGNRRDVFERAEDAPWGRSLGTGARLPLGTACGRGGAVLCSPAEDGEVISREVFAAVSRYRIYRMYGAGWHLDWEPGAAGVYRRVACVEGAGTDIRTYMLPEPFEICYSID